MTRGPLYGFGLVFRDPLTFAGALLVQLAASVLSQLVSDGIESSSRSSLAVVALLSLIVSWASLTVAGAALSRSLVFGRSPGVLGLQLGRDELRFMAIAALTILVIWLALTVVQVSLLMGSFLAESGDYVASTLTMFGAMLLAGGGAVVLLTGFSFAAPATIAEGRLVLFKSWAMTRRRGLRLAGAMLLVLFILVLISLILAQATAGAPGGAAPRLLSSNPAEIAVAVLRAVLQMLFVAAILGVGAADYLNAKGQAAGGGKT